MNYYNVLLYVFIVSVTHESNKISALNEETIVGGSAGGKAVFKHQAALVGRKHYCKDYELLCGAGIIGDQFVLTSARCFFNASGRLRNMSYLIIAGTINLMHEEGRKIEVDIIYMLSTSNTSHLSDIAVVKLNGSLHIEHNRHSNKIELPAFNQETNRKLVLVSGYGANVVKTTINPDTKKELRIMDSTDLALRFAIVNIVDNNHCKDLISSTSPDKQLCGIFLPTDASKPAGLCKADRGNPLIAGNTIIGIASRTPVNCDNRIHGSVYTKVSAFVDSIQLILNGEAQEISSKLYIYSNPKHIL